MKYTHTNKPVVYQKQTKNGFKNNININKDNFTNLLANFFVKVQLKKATNERNFSIFCDVLLVAMRDALILLLDKFLKINLGCSLVLAIPCTRTIFLVHIYVVFKAVFCLLLINYGFICVCVYFKKVERVVNLLLFTIYVISPPEQSIRTFAIICILAIIPKFVMFAIYFDNFTAVLM